jgi:hypothetical protein
MRFDRSNRSDKRALCERFANALAAAARLMPGVTNVEIEASRVSASRYLYIYCGDDRSFKIRISDHDATASGLACDKYIFAAVESLAAAVEQIARLLGATAPAGFRETSFAARSASATKAAATRGEHRAAFERDMIARAAAAITALPDRRRATIVAMIEQLCPGLPSAQRRRVTDAAIAEFKRTKHV